MDPNYHTTNTNDNYISDASNQQPNKWIIMCHHQTS